MIKKRDRTTYTEGDTDTVVTTLVKTRVERLPPFMSETGKPVVWEPPSLIDGGSCPEFCVDICWIPDTILGNLALDISTVKKKKKNCVYRARDNTYPIPQGKEKNQARISRHL
ncbi:hypothetical protein ISCGN_028689 [Ixodes scapularis]